MPILFSAGWVNALAGVLLIFTILGFHNTIIQWIWLGVNLGCIDFYAVLEWANDMKLHLFATKHKANTYHEHLIESDDGVRI